MFPGLIRFLFYALLIYIVFTFVRAIQKLGQKSQSPRPSKKIAGRMVKDPICNTYLPQEDALRELSEGKEYFFCSKECRQKFLDSKK